MFLDFGNSEPGRIRLEDVNLKVFQNIMALNFNFQNVRALDQAVPIATQTNAKLNVVEVVESHDVSSNAAIEPVYTNQLFDFIGYQYGKQQRDLLQKITSFWHSC